MFRKAERKKTKLKIAYSAPSGAGKTYSSLLTAFGICGDWEKIAVIDTENGSAELYSNLGPFSVCSIEPPFTADKYMRAIKSAVESGFEVLIIDSLSHAWSGEGGMLQQHDDIVRKSKSGNGYIAWRDIDPTYTALVDCILQSNIDIIATLRAKDAYIEVNDGGKKGYKKVGLAPIFRDGIEYEFTVFLELTQDHYAIPSKDRTGLFDGSGNIPTIETGRALNDWRNTGADCKCSVCGKEMPKKLFDQTVSGYGQALCSAECKAKAFPEQPQGKQ